MTVDMKLKYPRIWDFFKNNGDNELTISHAKTLWL